MNFVDFHQNIPQHLNPIAIPLGFFSIRWYALMYLAGFLTVYFLLRWRIKKDIKKCHSGLDPESSTSNKKIILDFVFYSAIGLLLGARLFFVFFYGWEYFSRHLLEIFLPFNFSSGQLAGIYGMSYHGGLLGVIIATIIFCRKNKIDFWKFSDFAIPAIPAGFFFGRLGNFLNGELYGRITEKWWGMHFDNSIILRHPSQLYEALGEGLLLFIIFWLLRNNKKMSGRFLIFYLIAYGIARFIIEFFRQSDPQVGLILNFMTLGQVLCLAMILSASAVFIAKKQFLTTWLFFARIQLMNNNFMNKKTRLVAIIVIFLAVCGGVGYLIYGYYKNDKKENVQENKNFLIHRDPKEILDLGGGYLGNDEVIIYGEKKVESVDAKTFYSIGKGYGKDKNSIFAGGLIIKDADRETFTALEYSYAKDKRVVYYIGRDLKGSDPKSFEIIGGDYSKDGNFVYSYGRIVRGADPKSFSKDRYYDLYKDKNNYYSDGDIFSKNDFLFFKKGIKVSGVKNIGYEYVSYKGKIYFYDASCQAVPGYEEVDGADAETFKVLDNEYANDKNNCYHRNYVIRLADPKTFKVLSENYAKDSIAVYYDGAVVPGLDPENFEAVNYDMWKNKPVNYYPKDILDNRCLFDLLKGLMGDFGRNENDVYVGNEKMEGADPKAFSVLGFGYSKDAQNVYYWKEKVPDADPDSITVLDRGLQITGADFIRPTVAKDKNNVFQGTRKIEGADLESFKIIDDKLAKDKSARYLYVFDENIFFKQ